MKNTIILKLKQQLSPQLLEVRDDSEKHRGHAGYRPGGNTHFKIRIAADSLKGLDRIQQHRAIMSCLEAEFDDTLHAVQIEVIN